MRYLHLATLAGIAAALSNVPFFGAPRLSIDDTLPNKDAHGNILVAQEIGSLAVTPSCKVGSSASSRAVAYYQ